MSIPTKSFLDEAGFAELEKELNPPAPVKDVVEKKAKPPPAPKEEDLDAVEAGVDGHIVTPVDDGGPGDGWAQAEAAEAAELVEKPLTKDADELAEFEKWAAGDEGAFDPNQFKDAPPTNDEDYSDDDEFYEEEDARRRVGPARKGADPTAPAATRRPNQFDRSSTNAVEESFRVAAAIAEQRNHSDTSDGETVSDSEASQ